MTEALEQADAGQRIARGGAFRFGAYAAGTLVSLVGIVFVTRALGPGDFGRFQALLNLMVVISAVTDVGLATLAVREYAQRDAVERARFLDTLLGLRIILAAIGAGAACAIVALRGDDPVLIAGAAALGLALVLTVVQSTITAPLFANLRLGLLAGLDMGRQVLLAGAYVALALLGAGLAAFLWASVPVALAALAATAVVGWRYYRPRLHVDVEAWRVLVAGSLGFALAIAVGTFYQYAAQLVMSVTASPDEVGYFSTAFRIYIVLSAVPGLFVSGAFPLLARSALGDERRFAYGLRVLAEATIILGGAIALGAAIGAPFVVDVIGGPAYADAVTATRLLGIALVLAAVVSTWGAALFALHAHRAIVVTSVVSIIPLLLLTGPVGREWGASGVAVLALAAEVVVATGYGVALLRGHRDRAPRPRTVLKALAAAVPALAALLIPAPPVVQAALAVAVFGMLVLVLRALPDEVIELAPDPLARRLRRR